MKIISTFPVVILLLGLMGCESNQNQSNNNQNVQVQAQSEMEGTAQFSFNSTKKDLGEIKVGTKVVKGFIFENTGDEPLVINDASASCGCTVPDYSKDPVPPGETGFVDVEYDSEGKSEGQFEQTVTLKANTPSGEKELTITGYKKGSQQAKSPRGQRRREIELKGDKGQVNFGQGNNAQKSSPQKSGQGKDRFGRGPNHPHYQHNHPPKNQQGGNQKMVKPNQKKPDGKNQGGKDKYGREPGHPHYQHNHPPKDQQQSGQRKGGELKRQNKSSGEGEKDKHGRGPDHPHYQHNHPPQ